MLVDENHNLWLFPQGGQSVRPTEVSHFRAPWPEQHSEPFAFIDYESYYSASYSLGGRGKNRLSPWEYVNHYAFDPYSVCVMVCMEGVAYIWVGPPALIPWVRISRIRLWLSHNAGFDELVHNRCLALGLIPKHQGPQRWLCTADMARHLQRLGSLQDSVRDLLGLEIDKSTIGLLKGGGGGRLSEEEVQTYNVNDCWYGSLLWCRVGQHRWPIREQMLSCQTRQLGWRGVWCDKQQLQDDIRLLDSLMLEVAKQIPWAGGGRSLVSLQELQKQCAKEGISAPSSVDQDDPLTIRWLAQYGATRPWIAAIRSYTKYRQTKTFFELLLSRQRRDGTVPFELLYAKAPHTQRWQSGGGLRLQNLDRDPVHPKIHVRHRMRPRPGELFVIRDCSQIEPRVLNWLAGDWEFLDFCKTQSPYEAHARAHMGYNLPEPMKKAKPGEYQLAKAEVLALGYQAGPPKFVEMARDMCKLQLDEHDQTAMLSYKAGDKMVSVWFTPKQLSDAAKGHGDRNLMDALANGTATIFPSGEEVVRSFRSAAKKIKKFWWRVEDDMRCCVGGTHHVSMPDGTILHYFDVTDSESGLVATVIENSPDPEQRKHFYGGKLAENRTQRGGRAVLGEILLRSEHLPVGRVNWHVHDEVVYRVRKEQAEELLAATEEIFRREIPWLPGLPLASEGHICDYYDK